MNMTMHMSFSFDMKAMFFINFLNTNNEVYKFIISLILVLLYGMFLGLFFGESKKEKYIGVFVPFLEFISMFVLMTYNFWIVLSYLIGKIIGFWIFAVRKKNLMNINQFSKSQTNFN